MCAYYKLETVETFAKFLTLKQKADWWELIACSGKQGVGKSCLLTQLTKRASQLNKIKYSYKDNLTWMRDEFIQWINGKGDKKENQKQEFSAVLIDELISLFYKRNWANNEQNDAIELMNKCRDRHLIVGGNVPNFWDLDKALRGLFTFWIHIPKRGTAWVFEPDENPFAPDPWHVKYNEKVFAKAGNPYKCKGFVCELKYNDWTPEDKKEYYDVRNSKRINTEGQGKKDNNNIKLLRSQRNKMIEMVASMRQEAKMFRLSKPERKEYEDFLRSLIPTNPEIAQVVGMNDRNIRMILNPTRNSET